MMQIYHKIAVLINTAHYFITQCEISCNEVKF